MRLVRGMLRLLPILLVASSLAIDGQGRAWAQNANSRPFGRRSATRKQAAPPPPGAASPNPLSRLFRDVLGERPKDKDKEPENGRPKTDSEDAGALGDRRGPRDNIDGRVPHNPSQAKQLEHAEQLIAAGHWDQALERLELVLSNSDRATVRTSEGRPQLVAWEANRLLARLPATALSTYRLRHEAQAAQLYREAQATGNWDRMMDVATQFFHTDTGKEAANAIGNFHFDRGEFGLASVWYARLLEAAPASRRTPNGASKSLWLCENRATRRPATSFSSGSNRTATSRSTSAGIPSSRTPGCGVLPGSINPPSPSCKNGCNSWEAPAARGPRQAGNRSYCPAGSIRPRKTSACSTRSARWRRIWGTAGRAPIPAAFPLMVKDRIAFRTLRGVHVLDAASGRLLWETPAEFSEDSLLAGYRSPFDFDNGFAFRRMRGGMWRTDFSGGESAADGHPLTGLLHRNANYGLLASDGTRLFVIEDDAVVMHGPAGTGFQLVGDSYENQRRTPGNRLTAYDLTTGREVWAIGGPANGESFDLPLAGNFFFGAPLVDGGELFVVGERDLDIRLYALDPDTGRVHWSQLLAHSDAKIEQDLGRRWWTAQVAYSNGILVCPTTQGWLVGVDRLNHSVLWMDRYAPPRPGLSDARREQGESLVPPSPLNDQWCRVGSGHRRQRRDLHAGGGAGVDVRRSLQRPHALAGPEGRGSAVSRRRGRRTRSRCRQIVGAGLVPRVGIGPLDDAD